MYQLSLSRCMSIASPLEAVVRTRFNALDSVFHLRIQAEILILEFYKINLINLLGLLHLTIYKIMS